MSRPKDPTRYPAFVYSTIEILDKYPERVFEFPCDSLKQAQSFQAMFNSFKRAAMDHGWNLTRCPSLASMVVRINRETFMVTVSCIDQDPAFVRWAGVVESGGKNAV